MKKKRSFEGVFIRNSRKIYFPFYLMTLILIGVLLYIYFKGYPVTILSIALVLLFVYSTIKTTELHRFMNKYGIKYPSLVHINGIFKKKEKRIDLFSISDAEVVQTFWQRIWKYGDINVRMFEESVVIIKNINNPEQFARFLEYEMLKMRRGD